MSKLYAFLGRRPGTSSWILAVALLPGLLGANSVSALEVDPLLVEAFAAEKQEVSLDLAVLMPRSLDLEALDRELQALQWPERRAAAIAALRSYAQKSQSEVLSILAEAEAEGEVEGVHSLWSANAVAFRGRRGVLDRLVASRSAGFVTQNLEHPVFQGIGPENEGRPRPRDQKSQRVPGVSWNVAWVGAPEVWAQGIDGTGVLVAHFDTGVWLTHPDLVDRLWTNPGEIAGNGIDDDENGYVDDVHGWDFGNRDSDPNDDTPDELGGNHGTHTAGTVCGDGSSGTITGAAPGATILVCKVTQSETGGAPFTSTWEAHQYALEQGARLLTMSMGLAGDVHESWLRGQRYDSEAIRLAGGVLFNSSGNSHYMYQPPFELASSARVPSPWSADPAVAYSSRAGTITVGGTGMRTDEPFWASSRGPADWGYVEPWLDWPYVPGPGLTKPDVSAPGEGIQSLMRPDHYSAEDWSGTSMACPLVAGVAALMLQKNPLLSPEDIDRILQQTAVDLGDSGKDNVFGAGRLDAAAAVAATPLSAAPYLVIVDHAIRDASGDGYVLPGESFELEITVANHSTSLDAHGVALSLQLDEEKGTVHAGEAVLGDLSPGEVASTAGQVLRLSVDEATPVDSILHVDVTLVAENEVSKEIDLPIRVGLPEMRDHDVGAVHLTITDRGTLGFWDIFQQNGGGFGPHGEWGGLFIGGLWGGNDGWYVCNRDLVPNDPAEWMVTDPSGRVAQADHPISDQDFLARFDDRLHEASKGIHVTQRSMAWSEPGLDEFVLLRYTISNRGTETVRDYHVGLFCDWDVGRDPLIDRGGVDRDRKLVYVYSDDPAQHYGMRLLGDDAAANVSLIPNRTWVWPYYHVVDTNKWILLQGNRSFEDGSEPQDYSSVVSAGPYDLEPGDSVVVTFALIYGENLEALQANADAAADASRLVPTRNGEGEGDEPPPVAAGRLNLAQNVPNPFNPSTTIHFELARAGTVRLSIYDLQGRRVRELVDGALDPGPHAAVWDGLDDGGRAVVSGMYLYRLEADQRVLTRKMMLVK